MDGKPHANWRFVIVLLLFVFINAGILAEARAAFSVQDLTGTWYLFTYRDLTSANDPAWSSGTITIRSGGFVTGGILLDNIGFPVVVSDGSLSLSRGGFLSGTITAGGVTLTISQGEMDVDKTSAVFAGIDSQSFRFDGNLIKAQGNFSLADLAGDWHIFTFGDHPFSNIPDWTSGTITIDAEGTVVDGSFTNSSGTMETVTSGRLSRNSAGVIAGSIDLSSGGRSTISWGKMDAEKNSMRFVGTDSQGRRLEGDLIKSGGTFALSDLAGKWNIITFDDLPSSNSPRWANAKLTVDMDGSILSGFVMDSAGFSGPVSGGALSLNSAGVLTGHITAGGRITTIVQGKMDASKTGASFVGIDSQSFRMLGSAVKLGLVRAVLNDFDGDGTADVGIYRSGAWSIRRSSDGGNTIVGWGGFVQDVPVHADYDGDGIMDVAIYRAGAWSIRNSFDGTNTIVGWGGGAQDILVPADYDGDGKADVAIYRDGVWSILRSSDGGNTISGFGGVPGDLPVPADYDGDGRADIAVYRSGTWFILRSSDGVTTTTTVTSPVFDDVPVPADHDGDGKTDPAIYRKNGTWFIRRSSDGLLDGFFTPGIFGGAPQDIPVPADYNGDGRTDLGIYRNGSWIIRFASINGYAIGTGAAWGGAPQDIPLN